MATKKKEVSFGQAFKELEEITTSLEQGTDLDQGIKQFERGLELASMLKKRLESAENKIRVIKEKYQAPEGGEDLNEE